MQQRVQGAPGAMRLRPCATSGGALVQRRRGRRVCMAQGTAEGSVSVYGVSDLHVDHQANLEWVEQLQAPPKRGPQHTRVCIVAGERRRGECGPLVATLC